MSASGPAAKASVRAPSKKGLLGVIGILPGEGRLVVPALAFAFLGVGAQLVTTIASDSLFVSTFSLGALSRFLVVSSVVRVFVAFGYAGLATRYGGVRLDIAVLAVTALQAAASGVLSHQSSESIIYAICIAQLLLPPLLPLITVNAAMSCFHTRQAKRLLPLVAAAGTVGSMAVGGVARALATSFGTGALLYVGALMCVISLPFPALLAARAREAGTDDAPPPAKAGAPREGFFATVVSALGDVKSVPVVRVVVGNAVLAAAAVAVVQFAFKASLKAHYDRDQMAGFIGMFSTVSEAVVLVAQLFLTSRFVARFGVRPSLESLPASLVAFGPLVALVPGVASTTAARFANDVLRFALGGPTSDLLLTPAAGAVRTRAKIFIKGLAAPLGGTLAGIALGAFGEAGPSPIAMGVIFVVTGVLGVALTRGAKRAYTAALAAALGEGRVLSEVSPASAAVLRSELLRMLAAGAERGDVAQVEKIFAVMSDKLFALADLEPALLSRSIEVKKAALKVALRLAHPGDGERLLAVVAPEHDVELERDVLAGARHLGARPSKERLDQALALATGDDPRSVDLWAEALVAKAAHDKDAAVKQLRKAALGADGPRRAAALRALGDLGEKRAEREILRAMASQNAAVFAEAARAAVLVDAQGAITTLVARLGTGPQVRATARALAAAGPRAVNELLAALPTTRGEKAILPTAVASERSVSGTIRAARVLARLGPEACARVLDRFGDLGYRARNAVARSFAVVSFKDRGAVHPEAASRSRPVHPEADSRSRPVHPEAGSRSRPVHPEAGPRSRPVQDDAVLRAMDLTVRYAEGLVTSLGGAAPGLYRIELRHRIGETGARVLDLASVLGDRDLIAQARAALARDGKGRTNALELLENILPSALAARTVALLDALPKEEAPSTSRRREGRPSWAVPVPSPKSLVRADPLAAAKAGGQRATSFADAPAEGTTASAGDGWLAKCEKFDKNELASSDPMLGVLEKVLVLRDSSLFAGLSGEELYPVAEIAQPVEVAEGDAVVREGDPGDALFVVASGNLAIQKGATKLREIGPGAAFGELALLDGAPRAASIVALAESRLLRIPREEFEALLDESPELARGVIRTLIGHLRSSS